MEPETPPVETVVETPASETQLEESTEELQTVAERILERTEELCQLQRQSQDQMTRLETHMSNLEQQQSNNRERLNLITDRLEQSPPLTPSNSVTLEQIPPNEHPELIHRNDVVDPQVVETRQPEHPPKRRKFRAI